MQLIYANFYPFYSSLFYSYFSSHVTSTHAWLLVPCVTGVTARYATNNRMVYGLSSFTLPSATRRSVFGTAPGRLTREGVWNNLFEQRPFIRFSQPSESIRTTHSIVVPIRHAPLLEEERRFFRRPMGEMTSIRAEVSTHFTMRNLPISESARPDASQK